MKHHASGVYAEQKIQLSIWKHLFELYILKCFEILRREEDLFHLAAYSHEAMQAYAVWLAEVRQLTIEDTWAISPESQTEKMKKLVDLEQACQRPILALQVVCEQRRAEHALAEWCVQDAAEHLKTLHGAIVDADARLTDIQQAYLHYSEYQDAFDQICICIEDEANYAYWLELVQSEYALNGLHADNMVNMANNLQKVALNLEKNIAQITQRLQYYIDQAATVKPRLEQARQRLNSLLKNTDIGSGQSLHVQHVALLNAWVDKAEKTSTFGLPLHARYAYTYLEHAEYLLNILELQIVTS